MRREVRLSLVVLAGLWLFLQFASSLTAVAIGDRVQVTSVTNIRSCAGTSCSILAEAPVGSLGIVLSGPTSANGYTWWQIDWDSLPTGWSIQNNITVVVPVPSVSSVSPTAMTADGVQHTLTINGSNFQSGNIVQFKWGVGSGSGVWNTGNSPSIASSTRMTVSMNPGTVNDTIYVRVCRSSSATNSSDCSSGTQSVVVTATVPVPSVSSVSPTTMTADGVQHTLTINGSNFQSGNIVQFKWGVGPGSGVWNTGNSPSIASSTRMTVSMNPGTVNDTIYVRVCRSSSATNSSDCSSGTQSVVVTAAVPVPSVSSVSPTTMTADGLQHTLTINGSNFQSGNVVQFKWGVGPGSGVWNTGNSPSIASSSQMTVSMNPGTVNDTIYVRVCRSSSATTSSDCSSGTQSVTVTATVPVPSVSSVSPTAMTADGVQHTLTINGSNFQSGNIVQFKWSVGQGAGMWNTGNSPSIASSNQMTVSMNPGTVNDTIYVRVCRSSSATTSSDCSSGTQSVTVTATVPVPSVSSVSPTAMTADGVQHTLTINGSNFQSGNIVQFKWSVGQGAGMWNTGNSPSIASPSQMTVSMNPGTVNDTIYVRVCRSSSATSSSDCSSGTQSVTVTAMVPVPSVSSISPTAMTADGLQHPLTINGSNFRSGNVVQFKWGVGTGSGVWKTGNAPSITSSNQMTVSMNPGTVNDTIFVRVCRSSSAMNSSDCSSGIQSVAATATTPPTPEEPGVMSSPGPQIACGCSSSTAGAGQSVGASSIITLLWRAAGAAQNLFQVVVERLLGGSYQTIYQSAPLSTPSMVLPSGILAPGNQYRWSVRGSTTGAWSGYSPSMYFRTETDSCVWEGPGTREFRMPVGTSGPSGGNLKGLHVGILVSSSPSGYSYPDLTFDEDGDGDADWYVATANGEYLWRDGTTLGCYDSSKLDCGSGTCWSDPSAAIRHPGEDWNLLVGQEDGEKAYAVADGVVIARACTMNYGRVVLIAHRLHSGLIVGSFYAHLASFDVVDPLTGCVSISKGAPVGVIGRSRKCNSDCSGCQEDGTGGWSPHLHFELRKLRMINQATLKSACNLNVWPASADTLGTCDWQTSTYPSCDGGAAFIEDNYFNPSEWLQEVFSDSFELGDFSLWQLSSSPHSMTGVWRGTVASYASELTIEQSGGTFAARLSLNQEPVEQLEVLSVSETDFVAYRPADDAELRLSLTPVGTQQCLNGEYLENGTSRPISLCKAP